MKKIGADILDSYLTVHAALEGFVTPMQYALKELGKRCSEGFIYKQMEAQTDIRYLNFLAVFKLWIAAMILAGNQRGVELILNHVELFIRKVKRMVTGGTEFPSISETERRSILQGVIADLRTLEMA